MITKTFNKAVGIICLELDNILPPPPLPAPHKNRKPNQNLNKKWQPITLGLLPKCPISHPTPQKIKVAYHTFWSHRMMQQTSTVNVKEEIRKGEGGIIQQLQCSFVPKCNTSKYWVGWGRWGGGGGSSSSNRILMSHQPHRFTSGQSNSGHKQIYISGGGGGGGVTSTVKLWTRTTDVLSASFSKLKKVASVC